MRRFLVILTLLSTLALAQTATKKTSAKAAAPAATVVTPDKLQWGPAPPIFPSGAQFAVLAGNPMAAGPFIVRLKLPDGYRIMPHWHPTAENVTVLSGEFRVAMGNKFDETALQPLPAHSVASIPPHHNHYGMAKGETELQINSTGPFKLVYVNPADDPTHSQGASAKKGGSTKKKSSATK
jgi:uncharacterized RmlC-like cupin family protein